MLTLYGMTSFRYYIGLFTADYILYCIPMSLFLLFIEILDLSIFKDNLDHFSFLMLMFGANLVTFTYFFSIFFSDVNAAFKKAPLIMLFLGVILPFALVFTTIATTEAKSDKNILGIEAKIFYYFFYILDPLMTFFMGIVYMLLISLN